MRSMPEPLGARSMDLVVEPQMTMEENAIVVKISVSHTELMADLTPLIGPRAMIIEQASGQSMGLKKSKERPLKDITNKLEVKPVSLKVTQAELKLTSGYQNKDSKNLKRPREMLIKEELDGPLEA